VNGARRAIRSLRTAAICLLVVVTTGGVPTAGSCLEEIVGCGSVCTRCACKHRTDTVGLRTTCPCCQRHAPATNPASSLTPAILPASVPSLFIPPAHRGTAAPIPHVPSFSPSVPHPPPRTRTLP
jgi:hypothetical protein